MKKKHGLAIIFLLAFTLLFYSSSYSQGFGVVDEATAGNFFVVGARALGMGGAYTAVANDATALVYNPAGLARVTRIEFSGTLTHQRISNRTKSGFGFELLQNARFSDGQAQNNTRFSSANVVFPVPTYRGSLVFALGVNRVKSFDKTMRFSVGPGYWSANSEKGIETESGGIYLWSFGGAIDVSPNVSVGASLNLWSGKESYSWLYEMSYTPDGGYTERNDDAIKDRYSGFNAKFGVRIQPNKYLIVGGTIDSPVTYTINEDWTQITETSEERIQDYGSSEYKISLPFSLGVGLALNVNNLILAGDISYTDWTQMEYKRLDNMAEANRQIKETYTNAPRLHVGAEYLIPQISTWLRAGYYRSPLPYKDVYIKNDRNFFTAGVGFLIDQVMTLDIAWAHGSWELWDGNLSLIEKYTANQIYLSTAYRF